MEMCEEPAIEPIARDTWHPLFLTGNQTTQITQITGTVSTDTATIVQCTSTQSAADQRSRA